MQEVIKMARHDNYPDDIRNYDHDPRSPFYKPKPIECKGCGKEVMEDDAWESDKGYVGVFCTQFCCEDYYRNDCCGEVDCVCE
jgi:hypothetical protein